MKKAQAEGPRPPSAQASMAHGLEGGNKPASQLPDSRGTDAMNLSGVVPRAAPGTDTVKLERKAHPSKESSGAALDLLKDAEKKASNDPGPDIDAEVDMITLLEQLSKQKAELRSRLQKAETKRVAKSRLEEAREAGKHSGDQSWKRPSSHGRVFNFAGPLPAVYLGPFEQQAACRPSRSYERKKDPVKGPFWDVSTYPQVFGEPPHITGHGELVGQPVLTRAKPETAATPKAFDQSYAHKKPWFPTIGLPKELDSIKFVAERLPMFPRSQAGGSQSAR